MRTGRAGRKTGSARSAWVAIHHQLPSPDPRPPVSRTLDSGRAVFGLRPRGPTLHVTNRQVSRNPPAPAPAPARPAWTTVLLHPYKRAASTLTLTSSPPRAVSHTISIALSPPPCSLSNPTVLVLQHVLRTCDLACLLKRTGIFRAGFHRLWWYSAPVLTA